MARSVLSTFRQYQAPLVAFILLTLAFLVWFWADYQHFRDIEEVRALRFAQGFSQALELYVDQYKGLDGKQLSAAFDLLVASTGPLKFVILLKDNKRFASSKGAPTNFIPQSAQGHRKKGLDFIVWYPFALSNTLVIGLSGKGPGRDKSHAKDGKDGQTAQTTQDEGAEKEWLGLGKHEQRFVFRFFWAFILILSAVAVWILSIHSKDLSARLANEQLERKNVERLGLAAAGLAHETKNPLGIILGHGQRLLKSKELPEEAEASIVQIVDAAENASERLGEFIEYARLRDLTLESAEGKALVEDVTTTLSMDFETAQVELETSCSQTSILCDKEMMSQLLLNLLLNSLHASEKGTKVLVSLEQNIKTASLRVADRGCGIDKELLVKVREPYVSGRPGGHGLGLAIADMIVARHHWTMDIKSEPGKGTTVTIGNIALSESEA